MNLKDNAYYEKCFNNVKQDRDKDKEAEDREIAMVIT